MDNTCQEDGVVFALPAPTDTPYRTPPRSRSRQSRRHGSASPDISSSPVPLPPNGDLSPKRGLDTINSATDESISPLDPRRFTPSLHASLVSEILSLRRDVEGKTKDIEHLEASLHTTRNENESMHETLTTTSKETRSLRRQLQLLEGGTVSALSELSKERDDAVSDAIDLRKRLELAQKKARSQEEGAERTQMLWDRDRGTWEKERRALETKVHIVEGHLKVVLSEIANSSLVNGQILPQDVNHHESPRKRHLRRESTASIRSMGPTGRRRDSEVSAGTQEADVHARRLSALTLTNGHSTSLADELAFDEEEEDQLDHGPADEEQVSADELPEERPIFAQSRPLDFKARKVLGLAPDDQLPMLVETEQQRQGMGATLKTDVTSAIQSLYEARYVDAATQYSPPASSNLSSVANSPKATEDDDRAVFFTDALSHQEPDTALKPTDYNEGPSLPPKASAMVSTSCQTSSHLPSPPWTPLSPQHWTGETWSAHSSSGVQMISTATQTDVVDGAEDSGATDDPASSPRKLPVPTIAIHPPASRPTTPIGSVVLPPRTKNASCQTDLQAIAGYTSSSMQTEEIRLDGRTAQLPPKMVPSRKTHLPAEKGMFPKSLPMQAASPLPNSSRRRLQQPGPVKPASSRRKMWEPPADAVVHHPPREDEEPVERTQAGSLNRGSESSASFVVPETQITDDAADAERKRFDEEDIFSRPTAKFTLRAGKLVSKDERPTDYRDIFDKIDAEAQDLEPSPVDDIATDMPTSKLSRRGVRGNASSGRPVEPKQRTLRSTSSRQSDIRKAALISSGAAAHQSSGDRSSSAPVQPPPFPVPTRHSSRKLPISVSEGAQSPTPTGRSPRKRDGKTRKPLLRKVRSATNLSRAPVSGRQRSPSPPLLSSQHDATNEGGLSLPPMPFDDRAPPHGLEYAASSRRRAPTRQYSHTKTDSASTMLQPTSVVDAIAQTMVGEWMHKYVRRRKSFGVPEPRNTDWENFRNGEELSASIATTGVRHKRWVWLAPYERAVMWSSKQPTSGSALMGKSGRKLEIQSVLDVRDDNPLPRSSGPRSPFNRSILILTPQRALKFTATSQERHYVWLTALSFLSHSPLGLGDLAALPHIPAHEQPDSPGPGGSLRRNPIRDSIRVAKRRDPRLGRAGQRSFTTDGVIPQYTADREPMYSPISDAADPPTVPRYHSHSRQRSNTAPRRPPSFRSFSNHAPVAPPPPSTYSMTTATPSDIYSPSLHHVHRSGSGFHSAKSSFSRRGSEASGSMANGGYFDPGVAPTVRMEAFIGEQGTKRPRGSYRTRNGRRKDMGYWGVGEGATMPGVDLPNEVVRRSTSPTVQDDDRGVPVDGVSIVNENGVEGKKHTIQADASLDGHDGGEANHFRGF